MAAAEDLVFALASPRRPTADDVDATLEDDGVYPPATGMPYADQLNQGLKLARACGLMIYVAKIEVHFAAGTPSVYGVNAANDSIVPGTFTVTDNGSGDTTITWPADTFPIATLSPTASVVDTSHGSWLQPTCSTVTNGVRVKTRNSATTLADVNFIVKLD